VITEDDREHSQDRKINELTTRMEALERRVKELEQARQR
jgi:polyhydroxyalkanoate synthesis regulator phasin